MSVTLAVDAMGGDHGLVVTVPASTELLAELPDLHIRLVGNADLINQALAKVSPAIKERITVVHASEVVEMDDPIEVALRRKKDSSMRITAEQVKEGLAQAAISAGNTGALMATARFVLKTLPGIDRPAIIAELPTKKGRTWVIDLGANVDSCAEHLFQFAVMGSALIQAILNKDKPKIGLLNIGVEEIKGNDQVKRTAHMLSECEQLNYVGYVEGNHLFSGEIDVVVCDGFVGNVALKCSEGLASLMTGLLREEFEKHWWTKLMGMLIKPILSNFRRCFDPGRYNGASLIGLNGVVVKSHGGADSVAFQYAIEEAMVQAQSHAVELVKERIADFVNQGLLL
jgi:glycerol-3-phosphate acyltransferase PlsX